MNGLDAYLREGEQQAMALGNRGPIRLNADGTLDQAILDAYNQYGFYVFEDVLSATELNDLRADFEQMMERTPYTKGANVDAQGRPAIGAAQNRSFSQFCQTAQRSHGRPRAPPCAHERVGATC